MDLWVRSQDKECLVKVSRIDVDGTSIIIWDNDYRCSETYMGEYKTKERALEVLNEIQDLLKPIYNLQYKGILSKNDLRKFQKMNEGYITNDNSTEIKPLNNSVLIYEMPEE